MAKKKQQTVYSFGSSLRRAREKREYTREQIAERAGISPRFVSAIENDRRKPSLDVLIRLVHAIGTSFDEVLAPQSIPEDYTADRRTPAARLSSYPDFYHSQSGLSKPLQYFCLRWRGAV